MSTDAFKTVLRAHIPQLDGKSDEEVHKFFCDHLGVPDHVDSDGDNIWFWYNDADDAPPHFEHVDWNGKHGVEWMFTTSRDCMDCPAIVSLKEIDNISNEIIEKFGVERSTIHLISYSWYTGSDEPIYWNDEDVE